MKKGNMKTSVLIKKMIRILLFLFLGLAGLKAYAEHSGVTQIIRDAVTPVDAEKTATSISPLPEDTIWVKELYQGGTFRTETRKDKMARFQCSQCHDNKEVFRTQAAEMAHGDIILDHGGEQKPLNCFTCHKKDERDFLVTEKGSKVDMDHSYQMCGQCHFRQKKDWVGGAHGKRIL